LQICNDIANSFIEVYILNVVNKHIFDWYIEDNKSNWKEEKDNHGNEDVDSEWIEIWRYPIEVYLLLYCMDLLVLPACTVR
jgi:hypothetical protein